MTVCIGFHLGPYVMLVADTRITYFPSNRPSFFRDEIEKIQRTSMGLITGSGYGFLLDAVEKRITEEEIQHTDQVLDIIREERQYVEEADAVESDLVRESLSYTCWLMTYVTSTDMNSPTLGNTNIRLALSHPQWNYTFGLYGAGSGCITFPTGTSEEDQERLNKYLTETIKTLEPEADFVENLVHHVGISAEIVGYLAEENDGVSRSFQVGVQAIGKTGISQVINPDNLSGGIEFDWSN